MFFKLSLLIYLSFVSLCNAHVRTLKKLEFYRHNVRHNDKSNDDSTSSNIGFESSEQYEYLNEVKSNESHGQYICEAEVFTHYYITSSTEVNVMNNSWIRTPVFENGVLEYLCLLSNGIPIQRKCNFDKDLKKAIWENISNWLPLKCYREVNTNGITPQLHTIYQEISNNKRPLNSEGDRMKVTRQITSLINQIDYVPLPADVYYTSKLLTAITRHTTDITLKDNIIDILNKVTSFDRDLLRVSAEVNATNVLLDTFETYFDSLSQAFFTPSNCNKFNDININIKYKEYNNCTCVGARIESSPQINIFYINPTYANISGIAVYVNSTNKKLSILNDTTNYTQYRYLYLNESLDDLLGEPNLAAATFVPQTVWEEVLSTLSPHLKSPVIIIKVYNSDNIFIDCNLVQSVKLYSKIISITIPQYKGNFSSDLPFILRSSKSSPITTYDGCGYWNYSSWINYRNYSFSNHNLILCNTNHLTQFGYLVGGHYKENDLKSYMIVLPNFQRSLDVISIIGCSLSLLGLIGIWLTAILFPKWRGMVSRKVLLHLCFALTLQIIIFLFVNTNNMAERLTRNGHFSIACVVLGALMQYVILVLFMWMLSTAYLQFQRYVTVLGDLRPPHYVLKSAIISWGVPLIPTLLTSCFIPASYIPSEDQLSTNSGVCYPSGVSLIVGVIIPITVIVLINLGIFITVFYSITRTLSQPVQRTEKKILQKKFQLSILLFFILGLPWIFGILAFIRNSIIYSYLFCITATLQGFILFIFYVILDEIAINSWRHFLCSHKIKRSDQKSREMHVMTTSTLETN